MPGGEETILATCCPLKVVDGETWELLREVEDARHGGWPILAGTLDQTQSFMDAKRLIENLMPR